MVFLADRRIIRFQQFPLRFSLSRSPICRFLVTFFAALLSSIVFGSIFSLASLPTSRTLHKHPFCTCHSMLQKFHSCMCFHLCKVPPSKFQRVLTCMIHAYWQHADLIHSFLDVGIIYHTLHHELLFIILYFVEDCLVPVDFRVESTDSVLN